MLGINLVLGFILAVGAWIAAPYAAPHIAVAHQTSARECLISLRIASVLILLRSVETVSVSTQRAFEQYRGTRADQHSRPASHSRFRCSNGSPSGPTFSLPSLPVRISCCCSGVVP